MILACFSVLTNIFILYVKWKGYSFGYIYVSHSLNIYHSTPCLSKWNQMANNGNLNTSMLNIFFCLRLAFLAIAAKATKSLSFSVSDNSIGNVSATWTEVQQLRLISDVTIDYAWYITIHECHVMILIFAGYDLSMVSGDIVKATGFCDACGEYGPSMVKFIFIFLF